MMTEELSPRRQGRLRGAFAALGIEPQSVEPVAGVERLSTYCFKGHRRVRTRRSSVTPPFRDPNPHPGKKIGTGNGSAHQPRRCSQRGSRSVPPVGWMQATSFQTRTAGETAASSYVSNFLDTEACLIHKQRGCY